MAFAATKLILEHLDHTAWQWCQRLLLGLLRLGRVQDCGSCLGAHATEPQQGPSLMTSFKGKSNIKDGAPHLLHKYLYLSYILYNYIH